MNWYYAKNGTQQGPLPTEDMKSRIAMEEISPTDLAWCEGMADWMPVGTIAALKVEAPPARVDMLPSPGASRGDGPTPTPEPYRPPVATPPPGGASTLMPGQQPSQGLAIASMVCGILGILSCCAFPFNLLLVLPAIVLGHVALSKAKADPARSGGKGMAKAGLITGYIGLVFALISLVMFLMFGRMSPDEIQEKIIQMFPQEQQQELRKEIEKNKAPAR